MRLFMLLVAGMAVLFGTGGCNTVKGMGRDIQGAGEAISGSAQTTKEKMQ